MERRHPNIQEHENKSYNTKKEKRGKYHVEGFIIERTQLGDAGDVTKYAGSC